MASTQKRLHIPAPGGFGSLPFSSGVLVGQTFYLCGHIGLDPATKKAPESVEREIRLMMDSLRDTLAKVGDDHAGFSIAADFLSRRFVVHTVQRNLPHIFRRTASGPRVHRVRTIAVRCAVRNPRHRREGVAFFYSP
jgi:enamine deaminase RidA (YjgF/YER057c/UK114 family)